MSKHTPGDWFAKKTAGDHDQFLIYPEPGETVAIVNGEANAALIAAAPDMLDILTRLTEKVARANSIQHSGGQVSPEDWSELYMLQNEARTALAKAKGEQCSSK